VNQATLWGARFRSGPDPRLMRLSRWDPSHMRLVPYDLASSRAHCRELERAKILDARECKDMIAAIDEIEAGIANGEIQPAPGDEDIHTFLERLLVEKLGPLGGKIRAGRSRNDQAANDLKLYLRDQARRLVLALADLQDAIVMQSERNMHVLAPGFSHLQPAQPVLFSHHIMAHAQAFSRDASRFQDWDRRNARSPLGAAALAGSAVAVRPDLSAVELGYDAPCENSIDAVGTRDHVAEFLFAAAMLSVNLSRLAEEVTLWTSRQFGWVELDDSFATGSSIMPQKKNPDIAELTRGRSARLIGAMSTMLIALKGLPLAYNRDLAEDKKAAFDSIDALEIVLPAMAGMIRTMEVRSDVIARDAVDGFTLATEVADWLSRQGIPFREAHEITGALVKYCEDKNVGLEDLSAEDVASVDVRMTAEMLPHLTPQAAVAARSGYGGTAPVRVAEQITRLRNVVEAQCTWATSYEGPRA
jgi:argininosuccinate lyase